MNDHGGKGAQSAPDANTAGAWRASPADRVRSGRRGPNPMQNDDTSCSCTTRCARNSLRSAAAPSGGCARSWISQGRHVGRRRARQEAQGRDRILFMLGRPPPTRRAGRHPPATLRNCRGWVKADRQSAQFPSGVRTRQCDSVGAHLVGRLASDSSRPYSQFWMPWRASSSIVSQHPHDGALVFVSDSLPTAVSS